MKRSDFAKRRARDRATPTCFPSPSLPSSLPPASHLPAALFLTFARATPHVRELIVRIKPPFARESMGGGGREAAVVTIDRAKNRNLPYLAKEEIVTVVRDWTKIKRAGRGEKGGREVVRIMRKLPATDETFDVFKVGVGGPSPRFSLIDAEFRGRSVRREDSD